MSKKLTLTFAILMLITAQAMASDWWYFRRDGSREILRPSSEIVTIKFTSADPGQQFTQSIQASTALADDYTPVAVGPGFYQFAVEPDANLDELIPALLTLPEVLVVNPVFELDNERTLYMSDQIILRFKSGVSEAEQVQLLESMALDIVREPSAAAPFLLASLTEQSPRDVFAVSRSLFLSGLCRYASPNGYGDTDDVLGGPSGEVSDTFDWSYYRRDGSRYELVPCESLVTIQFTAADPGDQVMGSLQSGTALKDDYEPVDVGLGFWQFGVENGASLDMLITDLLTEPNVQLVNPVFLLENGKLMYASNQIILRAKATGDMQELSDLLELYSLAIIESPDQSVPFYLVALTPDSPQSLFGVADGLFESDLCKYAVPNMYGDLDENSVSPNDTYYSQQWNLHHPSTPPGVAGADIDMEAAWEYAVGDTGTVVAIIDYAFDIDHVDLGSSKLIAPYDAVGNHLNQPPGPDNNPRLPTDANRFLSVFRHGTSCLGMIRSITNNNAGIATPGRNFYFMPIKSYDDTGARDEAAAARAWAWAINLDVEAISFSIGYGSNLESVNDLFEEAYDRGIPILCSAGNDYNPSKPIRYPATLPQALAIGATDESDVITSFSCRGQKIGIVAPGINLFTLDVSGSELGYNRASLNPNPCGELDYDYFCSFGGTSAAAPEVAAIAALVLSRRPDLKCGTCTADAVYEVLRHSAEDQINGSDPVGFDTTYGWGRLNAARALLAVVRGDADNNGLITVSDANYLINYIFAGGPAPVPQKLTGDADGNGIITISDASFIINYIFAGGPPPPISFKY